MRSSRLQGSFIVFASIYYLTTMVGIVLAYAVAALVPNMEAANAILPTLVTLWMCTRVPTKHPSDPHGR